MKTCFSCFEPIKAGRLPACKKCTALYAEAYGKLWLSRPEVITLINHHRRLEYQQLQIDRLIESGTYEREKDQKSLDDLIVEMLHSGATSKQIVERLENREVRGRSIAQLYRRVRTVRTLTGIWEGGRK